MYLLTIVLNKRANLILHEQRYTPNNTSNINKHLVSTLMSNFCRHQCLVFGPGLGPILKQMVRQQLRVYLWTPSVQNRALTVPTSSR